MCAKRESKEDTHKLIIEVAERLFRQIGFQRTTVADIARELHMSPHSLYRFFAAKSEFNEAVCMDHLGKIEAEAENIAASRGTAAQKIRSLIGSVGTTHRKQYIAHRRLYDLIEAAITENWPIMRRAAFRTHGWDFGANHLEWHGVRRVSQSPLRTLA
jgi:AcrR family transcriptional regulator